MTDVIRGVMPFFAAIIILVAAITVFTETLPRLPKAMAKGSIP